MIEALELLRQFPNGYALVATDFHVLPLAFMVKDARVLIEIPGPSAIRALLEHSAALEMHQRFEHADRREPATLARWQYCYRFDDAEFADALRAMFTTLESIAQTDVADAPREEATAEWIERILKQRAASQAML